MRPNKYPSKFSSLSTFILTQAQILDATWLSEIDWYSTGLGVLTTNELYSKMVKPGIHSDSIPVNQRDFCIAIFNNLEGTRLELFSKLQTIHSVTGFGRPFGNWFPTYETYGAKLDKMSGFIFNMCPENSLYPGYYTEKCFHAKAAGCIPLYFADQWCKEDFNTKSFVNIQDFRSIDEAITYIKDVYHDDDQLYKYLGEPLLHKMPTLDRYKDFIFYAISKILSQIST